MDEKAFENKFEELMKLIHELPEGKRGNLEKLAQETRDRRSKIQSSIGELQESLDYLRLSVKYLVFDLEATRRENAYLRRLVEQANRDRHTQQDGDDDNFLGEEGSD